MKTTRIQTGGHPRKYYNDDIAHMQEGIEESFSDLASMLGQTYFLSDPNFTYSGGYMDCDAGSMVYKGEICRFDAHHVADPGGGAVIIAIPELTYRPSDPVSYADAADKYIHRIKKVKFEYATIMPVDYVLTSTIEQIPRTLWNQISSILMPSWIDFTGSYLNSWVAGGITPAYRLTNDGSKVEFKGIIDCTSATNSKFFRLPVGYRPAANITVAIGVDSGSGYDVERLTIDTDGYMYGNLSSNILKTLEGVSFYK